MSRAVKVSKCINTERIQLIHKGFLTISDLQKFIPASRKKATEEYELITEEIFKKTGKTIPWYGINVSYVLKHFGLTEQQIQKWAAQEELFK